MASSNTDQQARLREIRERQAKRKDQYPRPEKVIADIDYLLGLPDGEVNMNTDGLLPKCTHGNNLQDHSGECLEPPCGCRASDAPERIWRHMDSTDDLPTYDSQPNYHCTVRCTIYLRTDLVITHSREQAHAAAKSMREACVEAAQRVVISHAMLCGNALYCDCGAAAVRAEIVDALVALPLSGEASTTRKATSHDRTEG